MSMALAQLPLESRSKIIANLPPNKISGREVGKNFASPDGKSLKSSNLKVTPKPIGNMLNEQNKLPKAEDTAIDVIGSKRNADNRIAGKEDPDATECSSSFADTTSRDDNSSGLSDAEVESQLYENSGLRSSYHGLSSFFPMRKKKLTSHWRNFIHPLMWRCKWTELKIKGLESLASKYTRQIAAYEHKKHLEFDHLRIEQFGSKSQPYTSQSHRKKPLKRRKRKKVEYTTDTSDYMAHHNLFSYHEYKRYDQDGSSAADDFGNPVLPGQSLTGSDKFIYNNDWLTQEVNSCFDEEIFRKIDLLHARVHKMKAQLDSVMTKYGAKFSSSESLSLLVPCDPPSSSVRSPTFSACHGGDTVSAGGFYTSIQRTSEYGLGGVIMPDPAASSYGETIVIPDIIESTVGLLSSADVTQHQAQVADSCEKILDNILVPNETAEMEMQTFKQPHIETVEDLQEADISGDEESTKPALPAIEELEAEEITGISQEDAALKSHFPKNKRKRGERKAGSGGWNRQLPSEPDVQT